MAAFNFTRHIMKRLLVLSLLFSTIGLSACSGCSEDNNTSNNQNNAQDMSPDSTECTAGEVGCACTASSTCEDGAMCVDGMCVGAASSGLSIDNNSARSCEVLLVEKGARVLGVNFADGVKGAWRRQAPNVALAFARDGDVAFEAGLQACSSKAN